MPQAKAILVASKAIKGYFIWTFLWQILSLLQLQIWARTSVIYRVVQCHFSFSISLNFLKVSHSYALFRMLEQSMRCDLCTSCARQCALMTGIHSPKLFPQKGVADFFFFLIDLCARVKLIECMQIGYDCLQVTQQHNSFFLSESQFILCMVDLTALSYCVRVVDSSMQTAPNLYSLQVCFLIKDYSIS